MPIPRRTGSAEKASRKRPRTDPRTSQQEICFRQETRIHCQQIHWWQGATHSPRQQRSSQNTNDSSQNAGLEKDLLVAVTIVNLSRINEVTFSC